METATPPLLIVCSIRFLGGRVRSVWSQQAFIMNISSTPIAKVIKRIYRYWLAVQSNRPTNYQEWNDGVYNVVGNPDQ